VLNSAAPEPRQQENGRMRWQQTLTLAPTAPGELKLELTALVYREGDGEPRTIAWKSFAVPVETQIKNADANAVRDITATEEMPALPERSVPTWVWVAVPGGVLLAAMLAAWLWLRRRPARRPASAQQKAQRECARLLAMKLPEKGHARSFVMLLSGIVRRYLERRFDIPARRRTTAELLHAIDACAELDDAAKRWLHAFFAETDLVKYAATEPSGERCLALAEEVRQTCAPT